MALSVLNNIPALAAENQLTVTQENLNSTLLQLSSGSRINSGADDAAGLAIANGLQANITALTQSVQNANNGVGSLQVADGSLGQVTTILNRAITLGTEAATGTVSDSQRVALNAEYQSILAEINSIGLNTTFNGAPVFTSGTTSIFLSDSTVAGTTTIVVSTGLLSASGVGGLGLSGDLSSQADAVSELANINAAITQVASARGNIGAGINRLQAASTVISNEIQNLTTAEDGITAADIPTVVSNLSKYSILEQTGISALAQANAAQQQVLNLLH
ncbi:MAG TPA: flagellin [Candidatus Sulfotelmatobacter sp.]|nr:flagellin [Candidatus Sulfotelmatobacter sp.]